jgi:hypothetical protein
MMIGVRMRIGAFTVRDSFRQPTHNQ